MISFKNYPLKSLIINSPIIDFFFWTHIMLSYNKSLNFTIPKNLTACIELVFFSNFFLSFLWPIFPLRFFKLHNSSCELHKCCYLVHLYIKQFSPSGRNVWNRYIIPRISLNLHFFIIEQHFFAYIFLDTISTCFYKSKFTMF